MKGEILIRSPVSPKDVRPYISQHVKNLWQCQWDEYDNNKLHHIQGSLDEPIENTLSLRRDQIVFTRCLDGHTNLTYVHYIKKRQGPNAIIAKHP